MRLWASVVDQGLCKVEVLPLQGPAPTLGVLVETSRGSPDFSPDVGRLSGPALAKAPSGWRCTSALDARSPWIGLAKEPRMAEQAAASLPAALALSRMTQALGAAGLLPHNVF